MNRIQELLKMQGRTQKFLSEKLNRSENTIYNWSNNRSQPNVIEANEIAKILGCRIEELIVDKEKK